MDIELDNSLKKQQRSLKKRVDSVKELARSVKELEDLEYTHVDSVRETAGLQDKRSRFQSSRPPLGPQATPHTRWVRTETWQVDGVTNDISPTLFDYLSTSMQ